MHFERGKNYCVEAASGIGKSSLLHFIGGFRSDYIGTITLDQRDIRDFTPRDRALLYRIELAYVFQDLRLFPNLTAFENVQIVNQQTSFRSEEEIRALFEQVGLSDKWDQPAKILSWGQQQRVAIVRAICQPFDFILLDEPVSHLDRKNNLIVAEIIAEEANRTGAGIVTTSVGHGLLLDGAQTICL